MCSTRIKNDFTRMECEQDGARITSVMYYFTNIHVHHSLLSFKQEPNITYI